MATRVLQRFIMPLDKDPDVFALYVDPEPAVLDADKDSIGGDKNAKAVNNAALRQSTSTGAKVAVEDVLGRHSVRIREGQELSFGSYFNGFAAGYWRRWTIVDAVRLDVTLTGPGAHVIVYRSMANGRSQKVDDAVIEGAGETTVSFDLTLVPFQDGGWYWFDVITGEGDAVLSGATWSAEVPEDRVAPRSATVGITTMNRPDFCAALLESLGADADVLGLLDEVLVMEQGTKKVADDAGFPAAEKALQGKLRVIEQANLGGSGGFARAQLETLRAGKSAYVLFLDDDIICEPESILRAVTFGDLARRPTIVGGHMFSIYSRSRLHSFGEIINRYRFWWHSAPTVHPDWDFGARNLRSTRWLHKRIDVDFNPWFMCLIPVEVVERIGLGLPLFIKWDDSEYGVRAQAAGFPTVSMPGAAVWHVPWTDKNDALDWQAYFHQRNRFVAALLHSPFKRGGRMVTESFQHQVMHLMSMQYSVVEMRHQALLDVLDGPGKLHADLPTKLGEIREMRKEWRDADLKADPDAFPAPRRAKPKKRDMDAEIPGAMQQRKAKLIGAVRQFKGVRPLSREFPETALPAMDAKWYRLAGLDAAVVSMPDGTSAAFYQRDPEQFRAAMKKTIEIHKRLLREWPTLAEQYRAGLGEVTSQEAWARTFGIEEAQ
ncbi:glycosyltransferase [Nocardioides jejuensis]|uniref:Glycosyltransferase family 2 protein n=1 Tax=Nocardioides jejuensis TaxID=2502782 RepID=A0A4R1BWP8_9ACTN|nr:glycosyltransferase [Nocardioides jejuensis]TCJ22444.1 glycosyltransferase family 2 protein [Nocardioides jejuensis]